MSYKVCLNFRQASIRRSTELSCFEAVADGSIRSATGIATNLMEPGGAWWSLIDQIRRLRYIRKSTSLSNGKF